MTGHTDHSCRKYLSAGRSRCGGSMRLSALAGLLCLVVIAAAMMLCSCSAGNEAETGGGSAGTDSAAVDTVGTFTTTDLEGNTVTEDIFSDKDATILNVWATFCGPCKDEMPDLAELAGSLPGNAQVVGIVLDVPSAGGDLADLAREIAAGSGAEFTNLIADESLAGLLSNITAVPTTFIIDSDGNIVGSPMVGASVEWYKSSLEDYLDEIGK